ncbi:Pimeloyl-ACP methyl ester carboxylesterase [Amycolatopsis xylanica]|uniref:Pimeloyl-ACP methyl ester carboxylesterase n=1 Tax=Amycolatopsis xylanica TaxID=589385 RepID=A0A1H3LV70_9PSEU|nr:alpha/beta hydrolase [Amycolatopsis xylanica]SDY68281.1 Pimeloyl-ACP methyl ester carboxylesterase [Amycolatopsis xylanica]
METRFLTLADGRRLAYLDQGGPGRPLLALHGICGRGRMFAGLARRLGPRWRVVAPDQRGHGWSDAASCYSREGFVSDAAEMIERLGMGPCPVLGHSLGGVNAFQLASWRPELVTAIVVEDIGARPQPGPADWMYELPVRFDAFRDLRRALGEAMAGQEDYFLENAAEFEDGWGFRWRAAEIESAGRSLGGDWWPDWLGSGCPALLIHGGRSEVLSAAEAREMVQSRPGTRLATFPEAGHTPHRVEPERYAKEVGAWLDMLTTSQ